MFRYETFLLTLSERFWHKEERHNLAMPSYSFGCYPQRTNSSHLSEPQKSNLLIRRLVSNSLTFFKSPTNLSALLVHDITRTLSPHSVISGYCDISEWHVCPTRITTYIKVCTQLTHVLSWKVLTLTKLKGMNLNPLAITLHYCLL